MTEIERQLKLVRFSDIIEVTYVPKDEDRTMGWLLDIKRFEERIKKTDVLLSAILLKKLYQFKFENFLKCD